MKTNVTQNDVVKSGLRVLCEWVGLGCGTYWLDELVVLPLLKNWTRVELWLGGVVMFHGGYSFGGHLQVALLLHFVTFGLPAANQICETSSGTEHILMK